MGYNTNYMLETTGLGHNTTNHKSGIAEIYGSDCFDYKVTWYEHQEDMKLYSKRHPDMVFKLIGEGDINTDIWHEYYKNGKMQRCEATITFDEYDENKLN